MRGIQTSSSSRSNRRLAEQRQRFDAVFGDRWR